MILEEFKNILNSKIENNIIFNFIYGDFNRAYRYREYHNLNHLQHMFDNVKEVIDEIDNYEVFMMALFYHDFIQLKKNEDDVDYSIKCVKYIFDIPTFTKNDFSLCKELILATKFHKKHSNSDVNYFIDVDLAILVESEDIYNEYVKNIRSEYSYLDDETFNNNRKEFLEEMLNREHIYHTTYFRDKYETDARKNITNEINNINNMELKENYSYILCKLLEPTYVIDGCLIGKKSHPFKIYIKEVTDETILFEYVDNSYKKKGEEERWFLKEFQKSYILIESVAWRI